MSGTIIFQLSVILSCLVGVAFSLCNTKVCNANEVCKADNGKETCVPGLGSHCWVVGDPHYRTFDGVQFDFEGNCDYTISKSTSQEDGLIPFKIEAKNENRGNSRVSFIGLVKLFVYGNRIAIYRHERGFVQVNYQSCRLPLRLDDKVTITQSGFFAYISTDFLKLYYDWDSVLIIQLSKNYSGNVQGMCGEYLTLNSSYTQQLSGTSQPNAIAFGKNFTTPDSGSKCWHDCHGICKKCSADKRKIYGTVKNCGTILTATGPFSGCHSVVDPKIFFEYCVNDQCNNNGARHMKCQILHSYVAVCQRSGAKIGDWRKNTKCSLYCPENTVYKLCASACPKTCNDNAIKPLCSDPCMETCECKNGYVLDGGKCIPYARCGCVSNGRVYARNETFWDDRLCTRKCKCDPATRSIVCFNETCKLNERCAVVRGIQKCQSIYTGHCTAYGDPHFRTFDKLNYNFQGICTYLMAGLWKNGTGLNDFQVYIQNKNRGNRAVSYVHLVKVKVFGYEIVLNSYFVEKVQVNGIIVNFPFAGSEQELSIHKAGFDAVIEAKFGLKVVFNWQGYLVVTIPGVYKSALGGLCGNFDGNPKNDFVTPENVTVTKEDDFGRSWTVDYYPPGCNNIPDKPCPNLKNVTEEQRKLSNGCGIMLDKAGPFRNCHSKVDPENPFRDCAYDACYYHGRLDAICQVVTNYATMCLAYGATIESWRSALFCDVQCPPNSHYRLCASGCQPTCDLFAPPTGCSTQCAKGCVCNDGYILSGEECVTPDKCGCTIKGRYYKLRDTFITDECDITCTCVGQETVECISISCAPHEQCVIVDGHPDCKPKDTEPKLCYIFGNSHYKTLDDATYDFGANCVYTLTASTGSNPRLVPFAVYLYNERSGVECMALSKSVAIDIYGSLFILQYKRESVILINGVLTNLPFKGNNIEITSHGMTSVLTTDAGIKLSFDHGNSIALAVPSDYRGQVYGLCGNFNGNNGDDLIPSANNSPSGNNWQALLSFWQVSFNCTTNLSICPPCSLAMKELLTREKYCGFLIKPDGPLSPCYDKIQPEEYFINCKKDLCDIESEEEQKEVLCEIIHNYVLNCQATRANIFPWRNDTFCNLKCPIFSHYSICAKTCSISCRTLTEPGQCPITCAEGCECDDGYFFDGQSCVAMENCGCFIRGKYYKDGQQFMAQSCSQQCTCLSGVLSCKKMACHSDEDCIIYNEAVACNKSNWRCSINPPNYVTFGSQSLRGLNAAVYDISFVCNSLSSSWFRIVADIVSHNGQPVVSKVGAFTNNSLITIGRDGRAWVNETLLKFDDMVSSSIVISKDLSLHHSAGAIAVIIGEYVKVLLSSKGYLQLTTNEFYVGRLCGLCGNPKWVPDGPAGLMPSDWLVVEES